MSDGEGDARGGAINVWNSLLAVENSTFSGNVAEGPTFGSGGGAIAVNFSASVTLTHVTITGNQAEGRARGGGIAGPSFETFARGKQSFVPITVANSIVAGNQSEKAAVVLNGKRLNVKRGKRLTAIIDLRGLTKDRYRVKITLHLEGGGKVSGVRRYWTCTPAIRWTRPPQGLK